MNFAPKAMKMKNLITQLEKSTNKVYFCLINDKQGFFKSLFKRNNHTIGIYYLKFFKRFNFHNEINIVRMWEVDVTEKQRALFVESIGKNGLEDVESLGRAIGLPSMRTIINKKKLKLKDHIKAWETFDKKFDRIREI